MKLPQPLVSSPFFIFESASELISAMGEKLSEEDIERINFLAEKGLPPVVSSEALATMVGINSGLVWSFLNRQRRHYRTFQIPKGNGVRQINAPRVALKIIQKWFSVHLEKAYVAPAHVFGFIVGRSHVDAAKLHVGATWAYSADIANFFSSTPEKSVAESFEFLGYSNSAAKICARLCCFEGYLAQGSPASPAISNICFREIDLVLVGLCEQFNCRVTRYADDIVFSGTGVYDPALRATLIEKFGPTVWELAPHKHLVQPLKGRIKVHGLLVGEEAVRLTKGYRNKLRGYSHALATKGKEARNANSLLGHVQYARHVQTLTGSPTGIADKSLAAIDALKAKGAPNARVESVIGSAGRLIDRIWKQLSGQSRDEKS